LPRPVLSYKSKAEERRGRPLVLAKGRLEL
jgi:hypothetical protein